MILFVASLVETLIFPYFQGQKNVSKTKIVKAPAQKTQPIPEPVEQESADDEEEVADEEPAEEQSSLLGSVVQEATRSGSHLLNAGTSVVRKGGHVTRKISETGWQNGSKVIDGGLLALVGLINNLGDILADGFKNLRKIGGAKSNLVRQTANNVTNLGVSTTRLAGQALNTPIKMLGNAADVASVGLTMPANAFSFLTRKTTDAMKAIGATDPVSSENEESAEEEEVTDEEDTDVEEPEPLVKQASPKPATVQKPAQAAPTQPIAKKSPKMIAARKS